MQPSHLRGIACMALATAFFAGMDAILKLLAGRYPVLQVSALRGAASLPFIVLPIMMMSGVGAFRPHRPWLHVLRGVLAIIMMVGFVYAVSEMSLADAYALFFVAPLLVTAMSVPVLGEHVDWQRWVAICVGLGGVIAILQPTGAQLSLLGALGALASATAYAGSAITVRVLVRTDSNAAMLFWFLALLTVGTGIMAWPDWVPVERRDWPWIVLLGAVGACGQYFITQAFRIAPASVIAPFEYTAMLWAVSLDWLVWSVLPSGRVYAGGSLVVASGLYLIWREHRVRSRHPAAETVSAEFP